MEKKQTAVQWLIENAKGFHTAESSKAMQEIALQIEREQIEDAFNAGDCNGTFETINRKQYYTQTFNN